EGLGRAETVDPDCAVSHVSTFDNEVPRDLTLQTDAPLADARRTVEVLVGSSRRTNNGSRQRIAVWIGKRPLWGHDGARGLDVHKRVDARQGKVARGANDSASRRTDELVVDAKAAAQHGPGIDLIRNADSWSDGVRIRARIEIAVAGGR